jgi:hypothetical protein
MNQTNTHGCLAALRSASVNADPFPPRVREITDDVDPNADRVPPASCE